MKTLALVLLFAAAGVPKGGKLFIKTSAVMWAKPDRTGQKTALKPGDEVTWSGPTDKDPSVHEVVVRGKKGYVNATALAVSRPADELAANGQPVNTATFAPSRPPDPTARTPDPALSSGDNAADAALIFLTGSSEMARSKVLEHAKQAGLEVEK